MINKRKVRLMTRTAMYEKHEGTSDLTKAKYYKSDYVGLHMWTTAVAVTLAYVFIVLLLMAYKFEFLINHLTTINYRVAVILLVLGYIALMTAFQLIAYFIYSYKYNEAEDGIKVYQNRLHKIFMMNKADKKRNGTGGAI